MHSISSTWPELLGQSFQPFTRLGADIFLGLMMGRVLCTAHRTITGMLSFVDPTCKHAHDACNRFFPDARWAVSQLMFSQRSPWLNVWHTLVPCSGRRFRESRFETCHQERKMISLLLRILRCPPPRCWVAIVIARPLKIPLSKPSSLWEPSNRRAIREMVPPKERSKLRGCIELSASRALASENKGDVRTFERT